MPVEVSTVFEVTQKGCKQRLPLFIWKLFTSTFFSEFFTSLKYFISPNVICTLCWAEVLRIRCKLSLFFFTKHKILSGTNKKYKLKILFEYQISKVIFPPNKFKKDSDSIWKLVLIRKLVGKVGKSDGWKFYEIFSQKDEKDSDLLLDPYKSFFSPSGDLGIGLVWDNLSWPHRTGPDHFSVRMLRSSSNWTKLFMMGPQLFLGWF